MFYFQGGDAPAKYDLVNWQNTPEGSLRLVLIGRVDGFDLHLNQSAIQWSTGSNQVVTSTSGVKATNKLAVEMNVCVDSQDNVVLFGLLFRCLLQCAVRAAPQAPEWPTGKENLSAALTVSHVLMGRLAIKLVKKLLHKTTLIFPFVFYFPSLSSVFSSPRFPSL